MTARLLQARCQTDELFRIIRPEFLYDRPIPERHRVVFYIGHLEAFDWNLLSGPLGLKSFNPSFDRLFAFGIDPVDGNLPTDQPGDWPSLEHIYHYRDRVREELDRAIDATNDQLLNVAIEHRLMHAETLAYIFHQMSVEKKTGPLAALQVPDHDLVPRTVDVPSGPATLGLPREANVFGWDNEFDAHTVQVPAFAIDKYKVTNGQFLEFMNDGGYSNRKLWSGDNRTWKESQAIAHPAFWISRNGMWMWRSMFAEIPLPLDWPVYVSHAEASAYATWAGRALPTEAQWHRAAIGTNGVQEPRAGNYDPAPVHALDASEFGVVGMVGNGWEWTSTQFQPFPGFRRFDCYPGYSEPFFDGKHFVLKGGSVRTAACMLRPSFRNWFQPQYQYVYAGFRCIEKEPTG